MTAPTDNLSPRGLRPGNVRHQDGCVTALADAILPLIRTRADLHRWSVANAHGTQMHAPLPCLPQHGVGRLRGAP